MDTQKRTRRGNGEAEIGKRGDSYWTRVLINGRRHSVTGRTKTEVREKRRELLDKASKGILPTDERLTVSQWMERWLEHARPSIRPTTYRSYEQLYRVHVKPALGDVKLVKLQPADIRKLYSKMQEQGLSASTIQRTHAVIRRALRQALDDGLIFRSVASAVHPPTPRHEEMHTLDAKQAKSLIAQAQGTPWEALITLALHTGMRKGELLGLKWQDVDLESGELRVRRQLGLGNTFVEPKTSSSRRRIDLSPSTVRCLREHRARQNEYRLMVGPEWRDNDLVFTSAELPGAPLSQRSLSRVFEALLVRAGLPDIRFHDLRHTAATLMLLANVPAKVVSERLGHATITLTLQTYSHALPTMGRDAANRLDALLG